jgi:hypothetical protein
MDLAGDAMLCAQVLDLAIPPPAYTEGAVERDGGMRGGALPSLSGVENVGPLPSYKEALTRPDAIVEQGRINDLPGYVASIDRLMSETDRERVTRTVGKWERVSDSIKRFVELPGVKASGFSAAFAQPAVRAIATWMEALWLGHRAGVTYTGVGQGDFNRAALDNLGQLHVSLINQAASAGAVYPDAADCFNDFAEEILEFARQMELDRRMCQRLHQWAMQKEKRLMGRMPQ